MSKTIHLASLLDEGLPDRSHFRIVETPSPSASALEEGGVIVKALHFSADPYLRPRMRSDRPGGFSLDQPVSGFMVGIIEASRSSQHTVGDIVGLNGVFSTLQIFSAEVLSKTPIWPIRVPRERASIGLGVLGMPGATAYGGLIGILKPKAGETILITGAAGAVGGLVGQIAKRVFGCKVIGTTSTAEKAALLLDAFGFDAVINYTDAGLETIEGLSAALKVKLAALGSKSIDMVFENVGGRFFDAAFLNLGQGGRMAICGSIMDYCAAVATPHPAFNPASMIYTCQRVEGFLSTPWLLGSQGSFHSDMKGWLDEGKVQVKETTFEGIEAWPDALRALFTSANIGKVVVNI